MGNMYLFTEYYSKPPRVFKTFGLEEWRNIQGIAEIIAFIVCVGSSPHVNLDLTGKPLSQPSVFRTPTESHKTTPNTPEHHLNELNDQMARCLLQDTGATYLMAAFTLYPVA